MNRMTDVVIFCLSPLCFSLLWLPLPACELSSTLLAFSIQQSAGRPPGGRVEAVCKEVQHQAFCQTRRGLQVRRAHWRTTNKSRRRREKLDSWERSVVHTHTNMSRILKHKTNCPQTHVPLCSSVLPNGSAGSVQAWKMSRKKTKKQIKNRQTNGFHHTSTSPTLQTSKWFIMEAVCVWCGCVCTHESVCEYKEGERAEV